MAVPKRRTSKTNRNSRRSHHKLKVPITPECPQCHQPKLPHHACPNCGYYRGRPAIEVE